MKIRKKDIFVSILFSIFFLYINYVFALNSTISGIGGDYNAHVYILLPNFIGPDWKTGWMMAPHCLWHLTILLFNQLFNIDVEISAAIATLLYSFFYYIVFLWAVSKIYVKYSDNCSSKYSSVVVNLLAFSFAFVQPLYFSILDAGDRYLGPFTLNPLHNPTQMCLRGFILLIFCIMTDIVSNWFSIEHEPVFVDPNSKKSYILLSISLFLSVVMKPTFAEVFIPAVGLYMLGAWIISIFRHNSPSLWFKRCMMLLLVALPALIYMEIQFTVFFLMGGSYEFEGGIIVTSFFEVWQLFSRNIPLSILFGMAFPIYMLILDFKYFAKDRASQLAGLSYLIGLLEAGFLGEEGRKGHANFIWPLMTAMLLVWFCAVIRLLELTLTQFNTLYRKIFIILGWILFIIHVIFGYQLYMFYYSQMLV